MKVIRAKYAGFCFGVKNAVDVARDVALSNKDKKVCSLGELIHNETVVNELASLGLNVINDIDILESGIVVIRSHGVGKDIYQKLEQKNIKIVDATCPYVKSIQNKVEIYHKKGYNIIIVGDALHPEVIGVNGWCENSATVMYDADEARTYTSDKKVCIVAQTTIIKDVFEQICDIVKNKCDEVVVFNTICSATTQRQTYAKELSSKVDIMVVVGGKNSSNTKKLASICKENCREVIHVNTSTDLYNYKLQFKNCKIAGLTAGASTPEQIILEVRNKMDNLNENFEQLLDDMKRFKVGDIVTGEVIAVNDNEVYINIGYKSDGVIKKNDFVVDLYNELKSIVAIGDKIDAMVMEMNDGTGNVSLSKLKVDEIGAYKEAGVKFEEKATLAGKITRIVKGGVIVDLGFASAYMPANQYGLKYIEDLNSLLGKEVEGRIIDFNADKNKIIFSRRVILAEERDAKRAEQAKVKAEAYAALELDQVITTTVKNIADYGIFVDLKGVDGFIHVSDLSWSRVSNPKNFCVVGDEIQAVVTELSEENGKYRIKLSIKALTKEPWQMFLDDYKVGDVVEVTVKNLAKFGAFAEIIPSIEGLIHISNLSYEKVANVESVLTAGDKVKVKIIDVDKDSKRIALSIKDLAEAPKKKIERDKVYYKEDGQDTLEDAFKKYLDK